MDKSMTKLDAPEIVIMDTPKKGIKVSPSMQ